MRDESSGIEAIIFDLGGVLVDWNPRYLYAPIFREDSAAMEAFLARVCPPEWNVEMDAGKPFAVAVAERQQLHPEHAELIALWKDGWDKMLREAIPETVELLERLRLRGHRLLALTNWSAETFPIARGRYDFLEWFEDIVVSGEVRLAKPDPQIFRLAIERNRLRADRTLFIDDSLRNVEAAREVGLHAVQFLGAEGLRSDLERLHLL